MSSSQVWFVAIQFPFDYSGVELSMHMTMVHRAAGVGGAGEGMAGWRGLLQNIQGGLKILKYINIWIFKYLNIKSWYIDIQGKLKILKYTLWHLQMKLERGKIWRDF